MEALTKPLPKLNVDKERCTEVGSDIVQQEEVVDKGDVVSSLLVEQYNPRRQLVEDKSSNLIMEGGDMSRGARKEAVAQIPINVEHDDGVLKEMQNSLYSENNDRVVPQNSSTDNVLSNPGKKSWKKLGRAQYGNSSATGKENMPLKRKSHGVENEMEGDAPSQTWRSLLVGKEVFKAGAYKVIGDGKSTPIWGEPWIPGSNQPPTNHDSTSDAFGIMVCDLIVDNGGTWDAKKLQAIFSNKLCQQIMCIKPNYGQGRDRWAWKEDHRGGVTVKGVYCFLMAPRWSEWEKPATSEFKINVDVGVDCSGNGVVGGIARDEDGIVLGVFVEVVNFSNDPILLGAVAIRRGLEVASSLKLDRITVESDAHLVVEMLGTSYGSQDYATLCLII
ncbi:putative mitochondrial protein [Senna tora]|uniref:Putative mitochondrial protein n=1 Tax=Senna tora TaxID=362788 RepID=A0A834THS6_9FABA|nr:putative mitochondrial protein [Senna tora]